MWTKVKLGYNIARVCEEVVGGKGEWEAENGRNVSRRRSRRPGPRLVPSDCCSISKGEISHSYVEMAVYYGHDSLYEGMPELFPIEDG